MPKVPASIYFILRALTLDIDHNLKPGSRNSSDQYNVQDLVIYFTRLLKLIRRHQPRSSLACCLEGVEEEEGGVRGGR